MKYPLSLLSSLTLSLDWFSGGRSEPIIFDDNIITSLNPATATDVAFKLLELLTSKKNSDYIKEIMGFNR
jgi:hypothetical protein